MSEGGSHPRKLSALLRHPICELLEGIGSELKHINEAGFVKMRKNIHPQMTMRNHKKMGSWTPPPSSARKTLNNLHIGEERFFEGFLEKWRHRKSAKKECKEENKKRININMSTIN